MPDADSRLNGETFFGAAVLLANNDVLCDVEESAREVPCFCGVERGVGETFA
jgi:hypothetical protein